MYLTIKHLHVALALISISGFIARGLLHLRHSPRVRHRFVRIAPHVVDTCLLLTGLWLAWMWQMHVVLQPWLMAKLTALLAYIVLGMVAFRFARNDASRATAWLLAILAFGYMLLVAHTKQAFPF
ncbi:hypothetical protein M911_16135 [Ectothiorhodospira haloalkaliphila]|uniref:Regulator SirB n=1 Tax=Ectothiorhodospira haloalkaliphila TaxID=421628 RepID=W8L9A3_9GAMM|nr:SirB2 family protein [Ectothiorhodospira haloalkaliphila]AHK80415.1 hypothetical protein M911_16135 [Ectothiorhodospira haloalkaliphila]MCG5526202.1 SirB2 family protein [Ectothiorhodospira haloalkaliphila]